MLVLFMRIAAAEALTEPISAAAADALAEPIAFVKILSTNQRSEEQNEHVHQRPKGLRKKFHSDPAIRRGGE